MTIAERQRMLQQRQASSLKLTSNTLGSSDNMGQWKGLDSLVAASSTASGTTPLVNQDDDWGLGDFASVPATTATLAPKPAAGTKLLWDVDDFTSPPAPSQPRSNVSQSASNRSTPQLNKPSQPAAAKTLWDLEEFTSPSSSSVHPSSSSTKTKTMESTFDSPEDDFDFGSREDRDLEENRPKQNHSWSDATASFSNHDPIHEQDGDEDDILGLLSKPVDEVVTKQAPTTLRASTSIQPSRSSSSPQPPSSPPPHILGQLVEMGFSIPQAKAALAQTPGGADVQMALETLLNGGGSDGPRFREAGEDGQVQNPTRDALRAGHPRHQPGSGSRTPQQQQQPANIQDQADKLLAQASEIGLSVLSKASLFWKEGRKVVAENVQKVVVDNVQKAVVEDDGRGVRGKGKVKGQMNGRPKWMQEGGGGHDDEEEIHANGDGGFKDDLSPVEERGREQPPPQANQPPPREEEPVIDLFAPVPVTHQEPPRTTPYVSPWRRGKPTSSTPSPAPVQVPQPTRTLHSIPLPTLHQARAHKTRGTELFKLGQFSGACDAYSAAIALLPEGHLLLVPLYTNRALGRLRVGDYAGTIEDAGGALGIVGTGAPPFVGSGEGGGGGWEDPYGRGVDLTDGWVKALKRRAEAWEGREKWDEARKDWETLLGASGVGQGVKGEAGRGVERCRRMVMGESESGTKPQAKPKPKPKPKPASLKAHNSQQPSQALQSLRASSQALESEEELKASLKDTVDAQLLAWKGGKETNIRALLASLDTVLWEDIVKDMGGKVALSELVLEGQVKKKYMRAVGRVHPDKLNTGNSTVEQRMLANGVFGALNEAWNAFK